MFFDEIEYIASPCQYIQLRLKIEIEYMSEPIKLSTTESLILAQDERWRRA